MSLHTPLFEAHIAAGGKLVDFAGWELPIHYGSQLDEHHYVRNTAGVFDVSHMTVIDIGGQAAADWLRTLLTNDVAKLTHSRALYSCMCTEAGGVIDDLIVYCIDETHYRLVVNAATRNKDIAWLKTNQVDGVTMTIPDGLAMLAVQGPDALGIASRVVTQLLGNNTDLNELPRFGSAKFGKWFVGRTGYTGEDGVEITVPGAEAISLWDQLLAAGVKPVGLGARDTLRLEAGFSLYGNDLDEQHSPVESGLAWTVDLADEDRAFIGREVLEDQKAFGSKWQQVALVLEGRGVLRAKQQVQLVGREVGRITSGSFSPSLQKSIGIARVNKKIINGCDVMIRDKPIAAQVVPLPFVRNGV